jgi:alpha-1,6-mannosyltransferase
MKVLDINNLYSPSGGGIRTYHHERIKWCSSNGIKNLLLYPAPENKTIQVNGGTVQGIRSPDLSSSGYCFFSRGKPLREIIARFNPDIIELGSGIVVPGMVRRAVRTMPVFAYFHSNWPETLPMSVLGITGRLPRNLFKKLTTPLMYKAYRDLNAVMAGSNYSIDCLKQAGITRIKKIPLGTNPGIFHPKRRSGTLRKALGVPSKGKMVLYMGRLAPEKGIQVLLKACPRLFREKNLTVVIAGSGHWNKKVQKAAHTDPDRLKLISRVETKHQTAELMASADVFVSAGPLETFSLTTLEALACGTPVAACTQAAASELVTQAGGSSTYSPWNSGEALAEAILSAASATRENKDGFRNFAEQYTWNACFKKVFKLYNSELKA